MTKEQEQLVLENYNLIYSVLRRLNLGRDEYEDAGAIGLCIAIQTYDESKGKFRTYAYYKILDEVSSVYRKGWFKQKCREISLSEWENETLKRESADDADIKQVRKQLDKPRVEIQAITKVLLEEFESRLTEHERYVLRMRYEGYTVGDVARRLGVTSAAVSKTIVRIRTKYLEFNKHDR